jgi:hypothetical protein
MTVVTEEDGRRVQPLRAVIRTRFGRVQAVMTPLPLRCPRLQRVRLFPSRNPVC